jgi:hypothetical protein
MQGLEGKSSAPVRDWTPIVQPVVRHYTALIYRSCYYYNILPYHELVKTTIKADRLNWLKKVFVIWGPRENIFGNIFLNLFKGLVIQIEVGDKIIMEPQYISEAFADHFLSILTLPLVLILKTILISLVIFWISHIYLNQTLSELLAVSIWWNTLDQMKFIRLFQDIYSSLTLHCQSQFTNLEVSFILEAGGCCTSF